MGVRNAAKPAPAAGPVLRRLKKGEMLFNEGDTSRAMYFLKAGMIRIFKKKGTASIEIDTIHSGQILGELAFLDGNPRSASGEALTACELVEISAETFTQTLGIMPDWLKLLLKTIVGRLRTASTRIRQLESSSTAYDYSAKDGTRSAHYVFFSPIDVLKLCSAILLVGARNGTQAEKGLELRVGLLQRYSQQIMGVPIAKMTTLLDVLQQVGLLVEEKDKFYLTDIAFLEQFIAYVNEENLLEPSKRHDLSIRGFLIMGLMVKHLNQFPADEKTGLTKVNLGAILKAEIEATQKEPFRPEEFPELQKLGYASQLVIKSQTEMTTEIKAQEFLHKFKIQRLLKAIDAANEQKGKGGKS